MMLGSWLPGLNTFEYASGLHHTSHWSTFAFLQNPLEYYHYRLIVSLQQKGCEVVDLGHSQDPGQNCQKVTKVTVKS